MFITRKRYEAELRIAEARGRKERQKEMEIDSRINAINMDMWDNRDRLIRDKDVILDRLERIEEYLDMSSNEKAN